MSRSYQPTHDDHETDPKKTNTSRGFFAVLILCLIAVGGVAAATFSDSLRETPVTDEQNRVTLTTTVTPVTTAKPAAVKPATTATTVTTTTTAPEAEEAASLYTLPLSNRVLTPFSEQPIYYEVLASYRAHKAIDFDGEEGQPVHPFAEGTVTVVENDALFGGCVTVDHGSGIVSVYRGIAASVSVGDDVTTETRLGTLDVVPCESDLGPHLHMELYKDGEAADAALLFQDDMVMN